jgi:hypothetical protein
VRQRPHQERHTQPGDDGSDQAGVMRHDPCLGVGSAGGQVRATQNVSPRPLTLATIKQAPRPCGP